jgi:hypothetical protein
VTLSGQAAPAGTMVEARIGETVCGSNALIASGTYSVDVAAFATQPGCGFDGALVTFLVAGVPANEVGTFQSGAFVSLPLTVGARVQVFPDYGGVVDFLCWDATPAAAAEYRVELWRLGPSGWQLDHTHLLGLARGSGWTCFAEDVRSEAGPGTYLYGLQVSVRGPAGVVVWQHLGYSAPFAQ